MRPLNESPLVPKVRCDTTLGTDGLLMDSWATDRGVRRLGQTTKAEPALDPSNGPQKHRHWLGEQKIWPDF